MIRSFRALEAPAHCVQPRPAAMKTLMVLAAGVILWFVVALLSSGIAQAAPAAPTVLELSQPNGVPFQARLYGDEWNNGIETANGFTILQNRGTGYWEFAKKGPGGRLQPSGLQVAIDSPAGLHKHLRPQVAAPSPAPPALASPNTGTQRSLVILVSFNDQSSQTTASSWNASFFGASNSVKDYYDEVSYGQLAIAPASDSHGTANDGVVGWLALNRNHPNTAGNTGSANQILTRDAVVAADPYVNFASFDTNGNGYLSANELHITVIPAGYEASYGSVPSGGKSVWGHQWTLTSAQQPTIDGVVVGNFSQGGSYTQFGEIHGDHQATIGIMVHEIGHDLNLPDLYDTDLSSEGVGEWSIMGSGSWLAQAGQDWGATPAHPDPFSRTYEGWLSTQRVQGTQAGSAVPQIETNQSVIQLLDNPGGVNWTFNQTSGTGEYFLVENRQRVGYDAALPGCGLLIWHIDETRTSSNSANANESRKLVDVEEADGLAELDAGTNRGDDGDPYPGSSNNRTFNDTSNPDSRLYSGASSGVAVTNISSACSSTMTADLAAPGAGGPANDAFANAQLLSGTSVTRTGDSNVGATKESGEPNHAGNVGGASVWYRWTPAASGSVTIDTVGSTFDTLLAAYTGSSVGGLTHIASNDDTGGGQQSSVTFDAVGGRTYRIAVDGYNAGTGAATGPITLHLTQTSSGTCKRVDVSSTSFTPKTATLTTPGACAQWFFNGPGNHSATESKGLGPASAPLFDSGSRPPGTNYSFTFTAAGGYNYRSTVAGDPSTMTGVVKVPVKLSASSGGVNTSITVTWASTSTSGYRSDVQIRFKPPGGSYGAWTNWKTDQTGVSAAFLASAANGAGAYQFRARLENAATGKVSGWSKPVTLNIT